MISKHTLEQLFKEKGIPKFRVAQALHAIYKEGKMSFDEITVLPKTLKQQMGELIKVYSFEVDKEVHSKNGNTTKALFRMQDGSLIEGVLMHFKDGRNSVCVSSQVGCGLKCAFCSTGQMGFKRNLSAEEIADQALYFDQLLKKKNKRVDHVIFMGMGEPFLNYENVMNAIRTLNDADCLGIAARHITVSTSGIIPGIERFMEEPLQINLAVSMHAPTQEIREKIMPIAKSYKLPDLMDALKKYMEKTHRRVSYEYVMLNGINDSEKCAGKLGNLLRGQLCHVNLIPYNETNLGFKNSDKNETRQFQKIVESFGIPITVRVSLGQDISAACGQLAITKNNDK
ncbi:23S rRNA (adenine(2503)-C(2))-methyltransferase RlmN [Candidatus Peregrinibacteria bacterium]|nr:23S rRNA (adenine(2503)-C(2))-methyltransferase RlmN [Candidatus Peregrinibacteria bacterium]